MGDTTNTDTQVRMDLRRTALPLLCAIALFVALGSALALTKAPWCDEGSFANPAYNLAFRGNMGINVLEPSGHFLNAYLSGIHERTYIVPPNHLVALAGWFRVFGFSLLIMREYSILWGALALPCLFYILWKLFPDPRVAQLGTLLTAIDFIYLWSSADGRMESSANALALASLVAYLYFRDRSITKAVAVSQIFGAAAVFTHPNAVLVLLLLAVLVWRYDIRKIRVHHLIIAAIPYLIFGGLWAIYIAESPADFKAQFFANASGRNAARWKPLIQPWLAVWNEGVRETATYVAGGLWSAKMNEWMLFVPLFYVLALVSFVRHRKVHQPSVRIFLACLVTLMFGMTFLNGFKAPMYLLYLVPFYDVVFAYWLLGLWRKGPDGRLIAASFGLAFVLLQITASVQHIKADEYHRDFEPAVALVEAYQAEGKSIVGTVSLGFGVKFRDFKDDWRLGTYSHLAPDVIVLDRSYRDFTKRFEKDEPLVFAHVAATLGSDYRITRRAGSFWIFERIPVEARSANPPIIDLSELTLKEKGKQAEYLFKQLSETAELAPTKESAPHAAAAVRF